MMDPPYTGPKMEARQSEDSAVVQVPREIEDPFRYGSRWVRVKTRKGTQLREVPLTLEDLFDPQEGDYVPHSTVHGDLVSATKERIRQAFRSRGQTDVLVCDDVKMLWKDPSLAQIAPDVAVIPGIADPERLRPVFDEEKEGTGPIFVLEIVSKATRKFDSKDKPKIYRRAGVEECFVLDPLKSPWELAGRRLQRPQGTTGRYRKLRPDKQGRVLAKTLGLYFVIPPEGDRLVLVDVATGEPLRGLGESEDAREAAESAREAERKAREAAELRERREAQARQAAESRAADVEAENQELARELERLRAKLREG
jgi:Uma2 family endonuclease